MTGKFELYKDKAGEFRFRLKAYESALGMENGVESVKNNAPDAATVDLTE